MATEPMPIDHFEEVKPIEMRSHRSPTIGKLVAALAKAQLDFGAVRKDAENEGYKRGNRASKYATLDSVVSATRVALAKNALVVIALPEEFTQDKRLRVTSILAHESEEYIESTITMPAVDRVTPQELGKLLTYARRYQWSGLTGIAPEDDDDGNQASGVGSREAAQEVGQRKIAELKAKQEHAQTAPTTLFFTYPERHNGNFADFINIREYAGGLDDVAAEGLRQVFKPFLSKTKASGNSTLIPRENMPALLEKLAGECGIDVHEMRAGN